MILYLPKWFWLILVCLIGFYILDLRNKTDVLYIFQSFLTVISVYLFFKRKSFLLASGLFFILISDLSYYTQVYKLKLESNNLFFFFSVSLLYSLGFLLITKSIFKQVGKSLDLFFTHKISIIPVLILIGASISFLIYPLLNQILTGTFSYNSLNTITEMSTSIPLIIISYLAIILYSELADACLAIGALIIGLVDWGIQFEYVTHGSLDFSYYDFFWFFGILLIFLRAVDPREFKVSQIRKGKSLRIQLKILILTGCLLPVGAYYFLNRGDLRLSISFFLIGAAISLLVASIVVQYFSSRLNLLTREIEQIFKSTDLVKGYSQANEIAEEWEESLKVILKNKLFQEKQETEIKNLLLQEKAELSAQVSHDIRSPLTALNMILSEVNNLQEDKRIMIKNAVNRINDIANTLLSKNNIKIDEIEMKRQSHSGFRTILVSATIDSLISEKRVQYYGMQSVEIIADICSSYGLFIDVNEIEIKRVISNLVNNSVEALLNKVGKVTVKALKDGAQVKIIIQDNGSGIPETVLEKLGKPGVTFGKCDTGSGTGLGIYHAIKSVESFGGRLDIESCISAGTNITMTFDSAISPVWFVENIFIKPNMNITSLDDDNSIHNIWKQRFDGPIFLLNNIKHDTFTSVVEFKKHYFSVSNKISNTLYLIDYEFLNQSENGLDVIENLGIGQQSILVTSRFEERKIQERCEALGVKVIPKSMAGLVPIIVDKSYELVDGILIDDDYLVHSFWKADALKKGKNLVSFISPDDFMKRAQNFSQNTNIFVDSYLGNGVSGAEVSKTIFEMGFKNIFLCTGYQPSHFEKMPWISAILGKEPKL